MTHVCQYVDKETRLIATVTIDSPDDLSDEEVRRRLQEAMWRAVQAGPTRMRKDVVQGLNGNNKG